MLSLAVLLLLVVLAARGGSAVPHGRGLAFLGAGVPKPAGQPIRPRLPANPNTVLSIGLSTTFVIALLALLFSLIGLLIVLASLRWRRRRLELARIGDRGDPVGDVDGEVVRTLLRGTRSALAMLRRRSGGPPGDAVQQAWLALEAAAAECGTVRRPEQTPTEFTGAVLADHDVDPAALATLRGLYQRARFGRSDTVTDADADAAITALDRIAESLAGAR